MSAIASKPNCASRTNKRCGAMKTKLHLKFFAGPIGLLLTSWEKLAFNNDTVVQQILGALKKGGAETKREDLMLKLRRYHKDGAFTDGIFASGSGKVLGYFIYAPPDMSRSEVEFLMQLGLNMVPFFLTVRDGDMSRIFSGPALPCYPEMPPPITVTWSEANGEAPIAHGC